MRNLFSILLGLGLFLSTNAYSISPTNIPLYVPLFSDTTQPIDIMNVDRLPILVSKKSQEALVLLNLEDSVNFANCQYISEKIDYNNCEIISDYNIPKEEEFLKKFHAIYNEEIEQSVHEFSKDKLGTDTVSKTLLSALGGLIAYPLPAILASTSVWAYIEYEHRKGYIKTMSEFFDRHPTFDIRENTPRTASRQKFLNGLTIVNGIVVVSAAYFVYDYFTQIEVTHEQNKKDVAVDLKKIDISNILESVNVTELDSGATMDLILETLSSTIQRIQVKTNEINGTKYFSFGV